MRSKAAMAGAQYQTTVLPFQPNSCPNCWNRPTTQADDELAPRSHGIYVSIPVYLVEQDGKITRLGYRAQCTTCGNVRCYPGKGCLYRLDKEFPDFGVAYWAVVRRNGLDPEGLQDAVVTQTHTRYFEAANLPKYASRHRAEFYEPKNERCELYDNL